MQPDTCAIVPRKHIYTPNIICEAVFSIMNWPMRLAKRIAAMVGFAFLFVIASCNTPAPKIEENLQLDSNNNTTLPILDTPVDTTSSMAYGGFAIKEIDGEELGPVPDSLLHLLPK